MPQSQSSPTVELTAQLIARASVTPDDAGCQALLAQRLAALGFRNEHLQFGSVSNLWSRRGTQAPVFVFAGHTDVVPTGPLDRWTTPPFDPHLRDGCLYGRGAADMKGSLAAMTTALERFLAKYPNHRGSIALLLTSDEEGPAVDGTVKVIETLRARGEAIDWCLIGEPSSEERIADTVKIGRRGSLNGKLRVHGAQGHVAYPQRADNPVHRVAPALAELCATSWDEGNEHFPPTSFQISNVHAGTGAENVIPGEAVIDFNFRFSTEVTSDHLQSAVAEVLNRHDVRHTLEWRLSGQPFLTGSGALIAATARAVESVCGSAPRLSTSGGTSDGRFIAPLGIEVAELGPLNASIHKIDEHVTTQDLDTLSSIYERILGILLLR